MREKIDWFGIRDNAAASVFIMLGLVVALFASVCSCSSAPAAVEQKIVVSKNLGCERYREDARGATDVRERGRLIKIYDRCRARVVELAGKYDAADVRETGATRTRDASDADFLIVSRTYCLFSGAEKLPKCFVIKDRRWAPSGWSLFKRDAGRFLAGLVAGFLGGKYGAAALLLGL